MGAAPHQRAAGDGGDADPAGTLLRPGHNVWRAARAERFALLLDGEEYFRRLRQALLAARRDVFLLGWDFDLRLELVRGETPRDGAPTRLGELLDHIVSRLPLRGTRPFFPPRVHVLAWDYSSLFALDREPLLLFGRGPSLKRRVRFEYDSKHPLGSAHHQKLVVIDDVLAFVGGQDLTAERWDRPGHRPEDGWRVEPDGSTYPPHHDVTAVLDGEAARELGQLARERWRRASRRRVRPPRPRLAADPWPADLEPDLVGVQVGIARTRPAFGGEGAVREVEALYLDSIARARRSLYLETQYLTAPQLTAALARRLAEPDGPEILLVHAREPAGWLEQWALGALIGRAHADLSAADAHGRLRIVHPLAARSEDLAVYVHSKVCLVDDRWLRVGSANLNQRSMGLDTECDVIVEARDPAQRAALAALGARLLGHWLGSAPPPGAGLLAALEAQGEGQRGLAPLAVAEPSAEDVSSLGDRDEPIEPSRLIDRFLPELAQVGTLRGRGPELVLVGAVLGVTLLALAWRFTPLAELVPAESLDHLQVRLDAAPASPLWVLCAFVLCTLTLFPVHLLILAATLVLGGWTGGAYAGLSVLLAAGAHFALGRALGTRRVVRLAGPRFERLAAKLRGGSTVAVVAVRLLPVAPFAIVNLACAAAGIPARRFLLGTLLGSLPSLLGIALFGAQVRAVLRSAQGLEALGLVAIAAGFTGLIWGLQRTVARHRLHGGGAGSTRSPGPRPPRDPRAGG